MPRQRRSFFGIVLALFALSIAASPAAAGSAAATDGPKVLRYGSYSWTGKAHYTASWSRTEVCEEGSCYWRFSYFEMSTGMDPGKECSNFVCAQWNDLPKAQFRTPGGTVLATITPPAATCTSAAWPGNWVVRIHCKRSFDVPIAATKVKLLWSTIVVNTDGTVAGSFNANQTTSV